MDYSFPRYLLAKQSIDDRALNRVVLADLGAALQNFGPDQPLRVIEVGAGIGTMLARLLRWKMLPAQVEYTLVDEMAENIAFARTWLPDWGAQNGYTVETNPEGFRFSTHQSALQIRFAQMDVFDFIRAQTGFRYDLLIAHAFLDLLAMPEGLLSLFQLLKPAGLAWLTINFDGVTSLEPALDPVLDAHIERLYHQSMDSRPTGGDSQAGRHLFKHLQQAGAEIASAGASDWVVYPQRGQYPTDEAYFLHFILHFFETSLKNHPDLEAARFSNWLAQRRAQIDHGELVYIAHQMDFLVKMKQPTEDLARK